MRLSQLFRSRTALLGAVLVLLSGCSDSTGTAGTGKISLLLTDAPGDVQAAVVTISRIYLQSEITQAMLRNQAVTTDLITLSHTTQNLVHEVDIPAGVYEQLRFVITGAYIRVDNGDGTSSIYATSAGYAGLPPGAQVDGTLLAPSLTESGLKVLMPDDSLAVPEGGARILLVDFDVSQSFGHQTGSGQWVLLPVIKGSDMTLTGNAKVTVTPDSGVVLPGGAGMTDLQAVLTAGDSTTSSAAFSDANQDGTFEATFPYLPPGNYSLDLKLPEGLTAVTTSPALPATLTIVSGQSSTASFGLTGAN